jgi:hypothetical protein
MLDDSVTAADLSRIEGSLYVAAKSYVVGGRYGDNPNSNNPQAGPSVGEILLIDGAIICLPAGYRLVRTRSQFALAGNLSAVDGSDYFAIHTACTPANSNSGTLAQLRPYTTTGAGYPLSVIESNLPTWHNVIHIPANQTNSNIEVAEIARADGNVPWLCAVYAGVNITTNWATLRGIEAFMNIYLHTEPI